MKKGFTLIELLVVVLIIGILSAVALPQYQKAVEKSRLTEALSNIKIIQREMDLYVLANGLPSSGSVGAKDMMTVELSGGEWTDDAWYLTENYEYAAFCDSSYCSVEVSPSQYRMDAGIYYDLLSETTPTHSSNDDIRSGNWYQSCYTQQSDWGRTICKSLENQGWKYAEGEI